MPVAALDNPVDLLILLVIALLIFGKNLPDVARSVGKGIREMKESAGFSELTDAINSVNQVRTAVSPTSIARSAIPGVAEFQEAVGSGVVAADASPATPGEAAPAGEEQPPPAEAAGVEAPSSTEAG